MRAEWPTTASLTEILIFLLNNELELLEIKLVRLIFRASTARFLLVFLHMLKILSLGSLKVTLNDILQLTLRHIRQVFEHDISQDLEEFIFTEHAILIFVERSEQDHELGFFLAIVFLDTLGCEVVKCSNESCELNDVDSVIVLGLFWQNGILVCTHVLLKNAAS